MLFIDSVLKTNQYIKYKIKDLKTYSYVSRKKLATESSLKIL